MAAWNYSITPTVYNEFRFGFTTEDTGYSNSYNGTAFSSSLGLQGLVGLPAFFNGLPEVDIDNLTGLTADRLQGITHSRTYQAVDNITWTKGRHIIKFGADYRHIQAVDPLGFLAAITTATFSSAANLRAHPLVTSSWGFPAQHPLITSSRTTTAVQITTTPISRIPST